VTPAEVAGRPYGPPAVHGADLSPVRETS
jgi:hypothetical protein